MENNWTPVSFSDAVNLNPTVKLTKGEEYPFVDMKSIDPAWREVSFSELRAFKGGGAKFLPKDTLMARITPCLENGKIARYLPTGMKGEAFGSTEFIVIRGKDGVTDNDFAYYLTMWPEFREFAISQMTGSSGRQRVPVDSLAGFSFNLPPLTEQKAIAHILGSLDDKIELNRRMNETLEAMAQALFKSWFIDFDPVIDNALAAGNEIPEELKERACLRRGFGRQADIREALGDLPAPRPGVFYVYAIQCDNDSIYIGQTEDLKRRWNEHCNGRGADWTKKYKPLKIAHYEELYSREEAVEREKELKSTSGRRWLKEQIENGRARQAGARKPLPEEIQNLFPSEFEHTEEMGWIPKGWKVSTVGEEFNVTMGQSPPGSTYNEAGEGIPFFQGRADFGFRYPSERVYCTQPKRFADQNDTLVSVRAPVGDVNMAFDKCCIGRGVGAVRHKSSSRSYTYYSMLHLREHFNTFEAEGTVFGCISQKDFKALKWLGCNKELIEEYENFAGQFDKKIEVCTRNILALTNSRDTLLPKLLSGEIRIPEAEKLVEDLERNGGGNGKS